MIDLQSRVIVVTGAASGIGAATSRALVRAGATVVLCDRSAEGLEVLSVELGASAICLRCDLTDRSDVDTLAERVVTRYGRIDALFANAGSYVSGPVAGGDADAWERMLSLNVSSVFRLVGSTLPHMLRQKQGDVIVTCSIAGHLAIPHEPIYSASKHAVRAFVHGVRRQVAASGVRVGEISPGIVSTPLLQDWTQAQRDSLGAERGMLSAEDVADGVLFMLSRPAHVTVRDLVLLPQNQDI